MKYLTFVSLLAAAVSAAPSEQAGPGKLIQDSPRSPSTKNGERILARFADTESVVFQEFDTRWANELQALARRYAQDNAIRFLERDLDQDVVYHQDGFWTLQ
jgi:hypothetical protein